MKVIIDEIELTPDRYLRLLRPTMLRIDTNLVDYFQIRGLMKGVEIARMSLECREYIQLSVRISSGQFADVFIVLDFAPGDRSKECAMKQYKDLFEYAAVDPALVLDRLDTVFEVMYRSTVLT